MTNPPCRRIQMAGGIMDGRSVGFACVLWGLAGCASSEPPPVVSTASPAALALPAAAQPSAPPAPAPPSIVAPRHEPRVRPYVAPVTTDPIRPKPEDKRSPAVDAARIALLIVAASRAAYHQRGRPCACPDDSMRNGRRCGGNSAYNRPGGARPLCYPSDVTGEMMARYHQTGSAAAATMGR